MKCKIVYVITGLSVGGAERMLLKLLTRLDREQFSIIVISLTTKGKIGKAIEDIGIPVLTLDIDSPTVALRKFILLIKYFRFLKPDLVHTWMYHADLLGGVAAKFVGVKHVIWSIRQSNLSPDLNSKNTLIVVKVCSWLSTLLPQIILCNSKLALLNHKAIGYKSKKMIVIPNGFDLAEYSLNKLNSDAVRDELGLSQNIDLVGMVARFDPQKNHKGFFEAAGMIHMTHPNVNFVLIGNDVDLNNCSLHEWVVENNIEKAVHLLGQRDDISKLMSVMSVLVSSSHGESFPNVIGEAMASGVPCVATDVGDCSEIIGDTGLIVDAGDMKSLAEAVRSVLNMPVEKRIKLGKKARNRVNKFYEITHIVGCYESLYKNMVSGTV